MLRLRPYKSGDAKVIVSWIRDEYVFRQWCADRYERFPITTDDINDRYSSLADADWFYPMTSFDESGIVGHLIMRFTDDQKTILRLGFVIVDPVKRGKGYGKEMVCLALKMAFDVLKVKKVTLGVFENNPAAYHCYKAAGFQDEPLEKPEHYHILGEEWNCFELMMENPACHRYPVGIRSTNKPGSTGRRPVKELVCGEEYRLKECLEELAEHHNKVSAAFKGYYPKKTASETLQSFGNDIRGTRSKIGAIDNEGRILGFCKISMDDVEGTIDYLIVLKEFRGNGYGDMLLDWALDTLEQSGISRIEVRVVDGNDATGFYEKYGFRICSHILRADL